MKPASVVKNLELMSRVLNVAHREWGVRLPINPASARKVKRPKLGEGAERSRTLALVYLIPSAEEVGRAVARVSGKARLKTYETRLANWHRQGVRLDFHPDVTTLMKLSKPFGKRPAVPDVRWNSKTGQFTPAFEQRRSRPSEFLSKSGSGGLPMRSADGGTLATWVLKGAELEAWKKANPASAEAWEPILRRIGRQR